jgi:glutathione synthase/RimK-type ligase-like ATP-grasp enzyme
MSIAYVVGNDDPKDPDPDLDIPFIISAATDLNLDVQFVNWHDKSIQWNKFEAAVIRSTWDYVPVREEFIEWAKTTETKTKLFNSSENVIWNTDKKYLLDLAGKGVPIIPTKFVHNSAELAKTLKWAFDLTPKIVIKPTVGAGARLAGKANDFESAEKLAEIIFNHNRIVMVQPYVDSVDGEGEKAIVIIDRQISHVAKKVPALTLGGHGDAAGQSEIDLEIEQIVAKVAQKVANWNELLYARVDVVRYENELVLMELEITEPWLFMQFRPESAYNLLKAVQKRIT